MSNAELRRARGPKHLCERCRDRTARFKFRGVVRADRDHTLCFECYRREVNRARARRLAAHRGRCDRLPASQFVRVEKYRCQMTA